jgi:hypothetical protein
MNNCKLPDCFPTSLPVESFESLHVESFESLPVKYFESFESLPAEISNNCTYTLYGCEQNKNKKINKNDENLELIIKEYKKMGACNVEKKSKKSPENFLSILRPAKLRPANVPPIKEIPLIGGCAGTRYGCDANGNPKQPPKEPDLQTNEVPKIYVVPKVGGCAGTRYGCDADGKSKQPPKEPELQILNLKGGCAGTRYGCDENGNPKQPPKEPDLQTNEVPKIYVAPKVGGCAGTMYGCDADGNTRRPPSLDLQTNEIPNIQIVPKVGGCAGTRYGCDENGNAKGPPTLPVLQDIKAKDMKELNDKKINETIKAKEELNNKKIKEAIPEIKFIKPESEKIIISEKTKNKSNEYNFIFIGISAIIIISLLYFLFTQSKKKI